MSAYEYRDRVETALDKAIQVYSERMIAGSPADLSEYRRLVGHVAGLNEAKRLLTAEYKRMFETRGVGGDVEGSDDETD